MRHLIYPAVCILLLVPSYISACSCSGPATFCQTVTPWKIQTENPLTIFSGQPIGKRTVVSMGIEQPLVDIVITDLLFGTNVMVGDTITFIGQDGFNCGVSIDLVNDTLEQIFAHRGVFSPAGTPEYIYPYDEFLDCGTVLLQIREGTVYGPIAPGVDSLPYVEFKTNSDYCIAGPDPLPEGCFCTTLVVDFCEEVARFDQAGTDFDIVRLRKLFDSPLAFDSVGYEIDLSSAVVTEMLYGTEFQIGDTVAVAQRGQRGCVEWNTSEDVLWAFTDVDYQAFVYTSRFNNYPRLLAPGCAQNTEEIRGDSVVTLTGLVPYADYLEQLAECVPALSIPNLSAAIDLNVYPNPVTDRLSFSWANARVDQMQLLDVAGRVVVQQQLAATQTSANLSVVALPPGIYFLRLKVGSGVATRKVLVR